MDRRARPSIATFFSPDALAGVAAGSHVTLGREAAHHARVRRLETGAPLALVDGVGGRGSGTLLRVAKGHLVVEVAESSTVEQPPPVHILVPIADRDRMLWLAEKCAELGVTSWRPVMWRRSRSVSPRGEGQTFQQRLRARMIAALEQSGGGWMPVLYPDAKPEHAIAATPAGSRIMLSQSGGAALARGWAAPVTIALGPEGGFDTDEEEALVAAGFVPMAVAGSVLRFETAGIAAVAIVRAVLAPSGESAHGP